MHCPTRPSGTMQCREQGSSTTTYHLHHAPRASLARLRADHPRRHVRQCVRRARGPWTEAQRAQLQKAVGPALDIEQLGRHPVARMLHGRVEKILLAALAEDTTMTTNPSTATRAVWHNGLSGVVAPLSALVAEARTLLEHQHAVHGARYGLILRSL